MSDDRESQPPHHRSEVDELFLDFLALRQQTPDADFDAFCTDACADRPDVEAALRDKWASLLEVERDLGPIHDRDDLAAGMLKILGGDGPLSVQHSRSMQIEPTGDDEGASVEETRERVGRRGAPIERYKVRERIGQGGMGDIFRVWDKDLRRQLAMKVIREMQPSPGSESSQHTRDSAERRLLEEVLVTSQLDHPGIVPVHEVGFDEQGQIYFTMKLVRGRNLRAIFDLVHKSDEAWNVNRAVGIVRRVCESVAYAHSKGIIHRDIKPDNIMVGKYGETYLMDWGLFGVLGARAGGDMLAPEQASGDAASSAGSSEETWGHTLEGRVGGTPSYMSPEQARGEIDEVDGRSDVYSLGALLYHLLSGRPPYQPRGATPRLPYSVLLMARHEPPEPLSEQAPDAPDGLVAICERAMARDKRQRYASAAEMGEALAEYLEDISEAREEARRQAARAQRNFDFLVDMLNWSDPAQARGRELTVLEVLEQASQRLRGELAESPLDQASLHGLIGNLFMRQGHFEQASPHLTAAHKTFLETLGPEHRDTLSAATDQAVLFRRRRHLGVAEQLLRKTLGAQSLRLGEDDPDTLRTTKILASVILRSEARLEEAELLYRRVVQGYRSQYGDEHLETLDAQTDLAHVLLNRQRRREAEELLRETCRIAEQAHGEDHPTTLLALNNLATLLGGDDRVREAEALTRKVLERQRAVLGERHPDTLASVNNLALWRYRQGDAEGAEQLLRPAVHEQLLQFGHNHPVTLSFRHNLALFLQAQERLGEAAALFEEVVRRAWERLGEHHEQTAHYRVNFGRCLARRGRMEEAEYELKRAWAAMKKAVDPGHAWQKDAASALAELYGALGRDDLAARYRALAG